MVILEGGNKVIVIGATLSEPHTSVVYGIHASTDRPTYLCPSHPHDRYNARAHAGTPYKAMPH